MVSRLLASLSGMLSSSPSKDPLQNEDGKDDIKNDNGQQKSAPESNDKKSLPEKGSTSMMKHSDFDLQFINAESLDRAIVNRLQSRMSTSVADALQQRGSESRIKSRCEFDVRRNEAGDVESKPNSGEAPVVDDVFEAETVFKGARSSPVKDTLSQSSVMSQDIPATSPSATQSFKQFVEESKAATPTEFITADELPAGKRQSLMYRNSQFNLENSSKEALCSNSSKLLPENLPSETILHLPMFGIPDPSLNRRPSLTSSTESIRGSVTRSTRDALMTGTVKKRARSMSPSPGRSYLTARISATQIGDHLFESTINDIMETGGDEFKSKYSSWIWDAFRSHLSKLKTLMVTEFNEKMKDILQEREHEVIELQKRYRQKLVEFDATTENFQKLMDNAYRDNQRVLTAKDFIINKLKKEFLECKKHFEQDLQRQMQSYRNEAEVERMELQKRNDELMLIMLTDGSKCGLEEAFRTEIDSLHKVIKSLTGQNEELHKQLDDAASSASILSRTAVENLEAQLDHTTLELMELRKKLQYVESEKDDMTVSYHQEVAKLNRKIQESNTRYDHQLRDSAEELENIRKKHARETKELRQKLTTQESQYNAIIGQVRQQYGNQVESLSLAVSQLRAELSGSTRSAH